MISPSAPVGRSRSNTCTSTSSTETPPLCAEESDESQASIDLAQLNEILSMTSDTQVPTKTKPRKHRRTRPQTQAINAGVYETIEEELMNSLVSSKDDHSATLRQLPTLSERCRKALQDFDLNSLWNDEQGMVALRKYYALRDEIENAVVESQRIWQDTPFSSFAAQSALPTLQFISPSLMYSFLGFDPPTHEDGMRAVLEHSMRNYGPLPSELHPRIRRRSRTHSRPSPYPPRSPKLSICSEQSAVSPQRTPKSSLSPDELRPSLLVPEVRSSPRLSLSSLDRTRISPVKRDGKQRAANAPLKPLLINPNVSTPALDPMKPLSPLVIDVPELKHGFCSAGEPRPRATSTARRTAPGSSKRSTVVSKTSEGKENLNARRGQGTAAA
jgi:serine/arginine repetitive matrix protein 2